MRSSCLPNAQQPRKISTAVKAKVLPELPHLGAAVVPLSSPCPQVPRSTYNTLLYMTLKTFSFRAFWTSGSPRGSER